MERMTVRILIASALAVAIVLQAPAPCRAADFTISPTTITLTNEPAADVAVTNTGTTVARISVHAYAWTQDPNDVEKLTESDDVVYFPEIFVLPPGGTQRIRVGVSGSPKEREQTYRLIVQELPPSRAAGGAGVTFVGRVDMPVFVPPGNSIVQTRVPKIVSLSVDRGVALAVLANEGNVHIRQSTLTFTGTDASGNVVWRDSKQPFYILAKNQQNVRAAIPQPLCGRIRTVTVRWSLRDNLGELASSSSVASCK
jgi:fimbrial chaperone protein